MVAINNARRSHCQNGSGDIDYGMWAPSEAVPDCAADRVPAPQSDVMWFVDFATIALVGLISTAFVLALMLLAASCVLV